MRKFFRRLLLALGVAVCTLLAIGVAGFFCFWGAPPPPMLPVPKWNDDTPKTGAEVTRKAAPPDLDQAGLRALVATNAEALRILRVGLTHRCAVPADAVIANFGSLTRDLIGLRRLAVVLSAEGRLAEMENRPADAARSYLDAIRLGTEMSRGGLMMNRLVGIACEGIGGIALMKLVPNLTCEQMRPLAAELETIDNATVDWSDIIENENRWLRAQVGGLRDAIQLAPGLWRFRADRRACQERHVLAAGHLRLLMTEMALRCYRADQGNAPAALEQLVPKYVRRVPPDPLNGRPLVYHPKGTNWLLYSVGPDRVDDGGTAVGRPMFNDDLIGFGGSKAAKGPGKGDLLYDSAW
jgi:hypothetical protein